MTKFDDVIDIKPSIGMVEDTKPKGEAVLDIKPHMLLVDKQTEDFEALELGKGMSIGPGWYMYVTYPITTICKT